MTTDTRTQQAVSLLEGLGLREYEARCFVALSRRSSGTAREISDAAAVPRPRVYDAVEQLETLGLVETQEATPRTFRAVPIDEAAATLRERYEARIEELRVSIEALDTVEREETKPNVWTLEGTEAVTSRAISTVENATDEVVFVGGSAEALTDRLVRSLTEAADRGVTVRSHGLTEEAAARIETALPTAEQADWNARLEVLDGGLERVLLADSETLLVSRQRDGGTETAVWTDGDTGLVALVNCLFAEE